MKDKIKKSGQEKGLMLPCSGRKIDERITLKEDKMIANYHTHTRWCNHAVGEIEDYIKAAIEVGLKEIAITDHVPHSENDDLARMKWEEFAAYNKELDEKIEKYKDQIRVIKGFECEYYKEKLETYKMFREEYGYEILILGQHWCDHKRIDSFAKKEDEKPLYIYANEVCEGLETGVFTFLAHPDLILEKYNDGKWDIHCENVMRQIFSMCERLNIPVEINVNGLRGGRRYPAPEALKLSKEYKLTYLINSDAHDPRFLSDEAIQKTEALAQSLNIQVTPILEKF